MLSPFFLPSCPPLTYSGLPEREYCCSRTGLLAFPGMSQAHSNDLRASARLTLSLDSLTAHFFASLMPLAIHHPFFKSLINCNSSHPVPPCLVILFHCTDQFLTSIAYLLIIMHLFWLLFIVCSSWTKALCKNGSLFSPLIYLTFLAQFLVHSLYSISICWMDMWWPLWPF